ncbi:MAG: hypothetical protein JRG97_13345 [Deltaproteobacteria bacterium]|nr:hypothetical protein [Deltaproteobacteria bacterium]MBW2052930.1 hypothetical protein [Deltaproteobacteria bacterium]MBW2142031.1 hypothetical protein [Deltaproteobacteria bacterium]MBW2324443.1 hypothetical protein [Deltaproteobacteria bacterium]
MGARRPTCAECGLIELDAFGALIWDLLIRHSDSLIETSGYGAFRVNVSVLNLLAEEYGFEDRLALLRGVQTIVREVMKQKLGFTNDQGS